MRVASRRKARMRAEMRNLGISHRAGGAAMIFSSAGKDIFGRGWQREREGGTYESLAQ